MGALKTILTNFVWVGQKPHTICKKVCDRTSFKGNDAFMGLKCAQVWETLESLVKLMEKPKFSSDEVDALEDAIYTFTSQMGDV